MMNIDNLTRKALESSDLCANSGFSYDLPLCLFYRIVTSFLNISFPSHVENAKKVYQKIAVALGGLATPAGR